MRFILDTNVLINDPLAFNKFKDHDILIPIIVLTELDGLKKRTDPTGNAARQAARSLDELREKGMLQKGVSLSSGGTLRIIPEVPRPTFEIPGGEIKNDHVILQNAIDHDAILVTEDTLMRVLGDGLGIKVERYKNAMVEDTKSIYDVVKSHYIPAELIDLLYSGVEFIRIEDPDSLYEGEYLVGKSDRNSALLRYSEGKLYRVYDNMVVNGLKPRNKEQAFLFDALLNPNISLVVAAGPAGSGKTLLSIAAGLQQVTDQGLYKQLSITRPTTPMGRDIGFLPGDIEEKLAPWMGPIYDAIEVISPSFDKSKMSSAEYYKEAGHLEIQPLPYIRGRSLPDKYFVVDEAQNLSKHEIKTIITRAGVGTKIVLTGDPYQIDSPYLDQHNNALSYVINKFKGHSCFAHVYLHKGERSNLAELAAKIM